MASKLHAHTFMSLFCHLLSIKKKKTIYKLLKPIVKPYKPRNKDKKLTQKNEE